MGSDSTMNVASAPALLKDMGKKKRANRSAKLKQCKLDARREQWLSQVKSKGGKESSEGGSSPSSPLRLNSERHEPLISLEPRSRPEEAEDSSLHDSDSESLTNSPSNDCRKERHASCGSSSSGSYSGSVSEEEEDSLDDWEAIADALNSEPAARTEPPAVLPTPPKCPPKPTSMGVEGIPRPTSNCRAWRPDDAFRPQSLPNLSKQHSFPMNSERQFSSRPGNWTRIGIMSTPSSCPICYEDLDRTDTSFLPCLCGFRLCLFCHKKILEADGRCPGCRKPYGPVEGDVGVNVGAPLFRLSRSCSMSTRY
ncbi:hypothetical protein H6P81_001247 [Aristolochia fimbriata]|uniref:RING-type domain-containing protein n=1 Tax=Aristolochia fimbriata TaxID=158543 RepID=A0AAV7F7V1_ARIFI|nr:hypothetical protein H6P81_001247 [Aristolochia fimbriata]